MMLNLITRIKKLEVLGTIDVTTLSDAELERLVNSGPPEVNRWLRGLSDDEL